MWRGRDNMKAPTPRQLCPRLLRLVVILATVGVYYCGLHPAMFDECVPRTKMSPSSQLKHHEILRLSLTDTIGGQNIYVSNMRNWSCVYTVSTITGYRLAMILYETDVVSEAETRSRLYKWGYGGPGRGLGLVWIVTDERGQVVETLQYRGAKDNPRVINPQPAPAIQLHFSLTGASNISYVPIEWKFGWVVWSVAENVVYHNNNYTHGLQNLCRNGTIVFNWTTPQTCVHSKDDVLPDVLLRSSDCEVDIVTPDDSFTLEYRMVTSIQDLVPHMSVQVLQISYQDTYGGPFVALQRFDSVTRLTPNNNSVDGVFGVRYSFSTGGKPLSRHLVFAFNVSRVQQPTTFMDVTTSDSTMTSIVHTTATQNPTATTTSTTAASAAYDVPRTMQTTTRTRNTTTMRTSGLTITHTIRHSTTHIQAPSPTKPNITRKDDRFAGRDKNTAPVPKAQPVVVYICIVLVIIAVVSAGAAFIARLTRPHIVTPTQILIDEISPCINDSNSRRGSNFTNTHVQSHESNLTTHDVLSRDANLSSPHVTPRDGNLTSHYVIPRE